jgi:hypothetical protein
VLFYKQEVVKMIRTIVKISLITLILTVNLLQAQAGNINFAKLDSNNILENNNLEMTIDNSPQLPSL